VRLNERKIVKTISTKKVAAIAVASLGFGLMSVVPAQAANSTPTVGTATQYAAVGAAATSTVGITIVTGTNTDIDSGSTVTISSKPVGSTVTLADRDGGFSSATTAAFATTDATAGVVAAVATANGAVTGTASSDGASVLGTVTIVPDVAGTYVITVLSHSTTTATATIYAAGLAYALGDGAAVTPATTGNGIAGPANTVTVNATTNASNTRALVTVSGAGATINSNAGTALVAGATSTIVASGGTSVAIIINTPTAGTVTVSQFYESGNGTGIYAATASKTVTITVGAAALNGTISVANSTSILDGTIGSDNEAWSTITADEVPVVTAAVSSTLERAVIKVVLKDTLTNVMPDATGISATITGPGLLAIGTTQPQSAVGRAVSSSTLASGTGTAFVSVYSDGTPGVATITITQGTTTVATEKVTFYGTAAKYTATVNMVAGATGTASTDAVTVCALDSASVAVPGSTVYAFSGDATVATVETSGSTRTAVDTAGGTIYSDNVMATAIGCYSFDVTALAQTTKPSVVLTFGNASTIATSTVTTTATVLVGSVATTTTTLTADKTTYKPGEAVVLTLTRKDSVGRPVAYGAGTGTLAAALTSSSALGTAALFGTANIAKTGSTVQTVYAPLSAGVVTVSGTTGADATYVATAGAGLTLSATFTVVDANQSALLTQIDALNAKIVALNALIAKIMKKLGVK
jgi:hypothetical protein